MHSLTMSFTEDLTSGRWIGERPKYLFRKNDKSSCMSLVDFKLYALFIKTGG